jgi:hypothetical protein
LLIVRTDRDEIIPGEVVVGANETSWSFAPATQRKPGKYVIDIGTDLEDLAGNNLRDVFDVDRREPRAVGATRERVRLPFVVE